MSGNTFVAELPSRALIAVGGPDWRGYLQGLVTQDVETLIAGETRFAALLTPQGKLLFDLLVTGTGDGCLIDCEAERREALIQRLTIYRLRARVEIEPLDRTVAALWGVHAAPTGWLADPRLPELGFRGYGAPLASFASRVDQTNYDHHRLAAGVPGPLDWGFEITYPIEANFDLLGGIDFKKGCFVGQETTSRMKRRGVVKSRMLPIVFEGPPPEHGAELLAGSLRAGQSLSGTDGRAMALLRLDRLGAGPLTMPDGRAWRPVRPAWFENRLAPAGATL
ncbi:MAG TPA: folate-binding protein [Caulobacteraceae bacterium]|nr:folate-binding protein [Caulobacteraceae bacterium]